MSAPGTAPGAAPAAQDPPGVPDVAPVPAPVPAAGAGRLADRPAGAPPARSPGAGDGVVVGDGTNAGDRARRRWRRWRWPAAVALLVVLVALAAALPEPPRSTVPLAPDNADDAGARAVAQILQREGVDVVHVRTTADAVAAAGEGDTLLVTGTGLLSLDQIDQVAATSADLVLLEPDDAMLDAVTDAAVSAPGETGTTERTASCPDADARAAGTLRTAGGGYRALTDDAVVCFPAPDGEPGTGALLVVDGERRVTALADADVLTNERLADDGNAALALRLLGRSDRLVWYVPAVDDLGGASAPAGPALGDLLPPWAGPLALQLALVVLVAAVWRGRRLGPLVTEPLPVTVRAAETTRGRGRLYRRSRAYGHAAAALRAGTARRTAARLGLPRSAGAPAVIDALARATGRPPDDVAALLYGPPPTDDAALTALARRLDDLESEVHRP